MEFSPNDFFDFGLLLKENPFKDKLQASYRTAVSRIYYSVFLLIRRELYVYHKDKIEKEKIFEDFGVHQKLIEFLLLRMTGKEYKVGHLLQSLKKLREEADYNLSIDVNNDYIIEAERIYKKIIFELKKLDWFCNPY